MFTIETGRLSLIALRLEQLQLLQKDRTGLEISLGLAISQLKPNAADSFMNEFEEALRTFILPKVQEHPLQYEWYTHWLIVERSTHLTIGGIGMNGFPGANAEVMVGYYIDRKSEGFGYATEALQALILHMQQEPKLETLIADTLADNMASQRVLSKAGFILKGEVEEGLRWELKVR